MADVDALADRFGTDAELLDGTPIGTETPWRLSWESLAIALPLSRGKKGSRRPWTTSVGT